VYEGEDVEEEMTSLMNAGEGRDSPDLLDFMFF